MSTNSKYAEHADLTWYFKAKAEAAEANRQYQLKGYQDDLGALAEKMSIDNLPSAREDRDLIDACKAALNLKLAAAEFTTCDAERLAVLQYDVASAECMQAVTVGKRTRNALDQAAQQANTAARNNLNDEIGNSQVEKANERVRDMRAKLHFWQCSYLAAAETYTKVVAENAAHPFFANKPSHWEPYGGKPKVRRVSMSQAEAQALYNKGRRRTQSRREGPPPVQTVDDYYAA